MLMDTCHSVVNKPVTRRNEAVFDVIYRYFWAIF
jgi:hypothetical protein